MGHLRISAARAMRSSNSHFRTKAHLQMFFTDDFIVFYVQLGLVRSNLVKNLYFTHFAYFRDFFTTFMRKFPGNDSIRERIRYKINYRKIFNTVFKVTTFIKKLPKSEILGIFFCEKKMKIFIFTGFDLPGPNFHCRIR